MLVPLFIRARLAEEFKLRLLKFARAEDKGLGRDFVAEALSYLGDAEWNFDPCGIEDVSEIDEDALGGLRTQIHQHRIIDVCAHLGFKHQPETASGR